VRKPVRRLKVPGERPCQGEIPRISPLAGPHLRAQSTAGQASAQAPPPPALRPNGFVGRVFDWEAWEKMKDEPDLRVSSFRWQRVPR